MRAKTNLSERVWAYGRDEALPERRLLHAGPLTLILEQGNLRQIRLGGREVLRDIYVAVRDQNWDTIPATLSDWKIETDDESFSISYLAEHVQGPIDFAWRALIEGDAEGTIQFQMRGEARSTFRKNRIGFCVQHPIRECAGAYCTVRTTDDVAQVGAFPLRISPHQPFKNMRAITHEVRPGLRAEVWFEGDTFEMEDHRNWTDASYKTYCTPLELPFPVEVPRGARIEQSVTLRLFGTIPERIETPDESITSVTIGCGPVGPMPALGLGLSSHGRASSPRERERLRALNLSHLRVDVEPSRPETRGLLQLAIDEAKALDAGLEVAVHLTDHAEKEIHDLVSIIEDLKPPIRSWLIFQVEEKATTEPWVRLARERLLPATPDAKLISGTNAYFTELNRGDPPSRLLDLVCYSINPQVHAFDNVSLAETLEAQPETVVSALHLTEGVPVAVTPITLKPRFNPNATGPEPEPAPGELPSQVDPRQMSLFGAGWTLGSLAALAGAGASSLTFFETTGWRGVLETEEGSPLPERFASLPGCVFPLYHVLADVGAFSGGEVIPIRSSTRRDVVGLALRQGDRHRVLLANLGPKPRRVEVEPLPVEVSVQHLDLKNVEEAVRQPERFRSRNAARRATDSGLLRVELPPFGLLRIDS